MNTAILFFDASSILPILAPVPITSPAVVAPKLDAAKAAEVDAIFTTFYKDSDKAREEMMASGERPSREVMQAKIQPLAEAREEKLKKTLPEAQYEIWKKQIDPGIRPQRPGGGSNK